MPSISVIVITRNEGDELRATVDNLLRTLPESSSEVIVVDDGSTDGSTDFLWPQSRVCLLHSDGVGVARARNFGASRAEGDVVVFSDAHMRVPDRWHEPLMSALADPEIGAVAPGVYSLTNPRQIGFGLRLTGPDLHASWCQKVSASPYPAAILPGCFLAMRRETFERTGGYDHGMHQLGGNDNELSCRFWLLGYTLLVVPEVEVGHLFRTSTPYEAQWAAVVHNRVRMALAHFSKERVERVFAALRVYEAFPKGMSMMLASDVFARRASLLSARRFDDQWYCDRFQLPC